MNDLLPYLFGGTGLTGVVIGILKWRTQAEKTKQKDNEMFNSLKELTETFKVIAVSLKENSAAIRTVSENQVQIAITMQNIQDNLELVMRNEIHVNRDEILKIKEIAWYKQRHDFYHKMEDIIDANGLSNEPVIIAKIKSAIDESIRETDSWIDSFNVKGYLVESQAKIDFICSSEAPKVLYDIITNPRNRDDNKKLRSNISSYCMQMLSAVKKEFYENNGKVRTEPFI